MNIRAIHHVSFLVSDLGRALVFYRDVLRLPVLDERPDLGYPGAWIGIGEQQLHLMVLPDPCAGRPRPEHGGRDRHVALQVTGLEELAQQLEQHAIPFTRSRSGRAALFCRDPDGNALEFIGEQTQRGK